MIRFAVLGIGLTFLGGCAHSPPVVLSDFAQNCVIIKVSRKDTPETLKQVLAENTKCRSAVAAEAPSDGR